MTANQSNTDKLFKGLSVQTIITVVMGVLEIAVFSIMSRLLTKTDFGYYATITALVAIFASISEAGLGSAVVQKKDDSPKHVSTAFTLSILIGSLMSLLLFILAPFLAQIISDDTITTPIRLMSVILLLNSIISIGRGVLLRKLKFSTIGIFTVSSYIISSTIGVSLAYLGYGLYAVVIANVVNSVIMVMLLLFMLSVKLPALGIYKNEAKEILSFGGWLTMGVVFNNISRQVDKLLLPKLISTTALGSYNRPAGFVDTITDKINSIFDTVLFPMLSGLQDNKEKVKQVLYRAVSLLNSFSVILAAVFFFNAELIITIFFGNEWLDLVPIMRIVSIVVIFSVDNRLVDCFFRSLALVKLGFQLRVYAAIQTIIFVIIGSQFGIMGVAISMMLSNIIVIMLKVFFLVRKIDAKMIKILQLMFTSMKSVLPIMIIGIPFILFVDKSNPISLVVFALLFVTIVIYEFVFNPQLVGNEYKVSVYPKVEKLKNKIIK